MSDEMSNGNIVDFRSKKPVEPKGDFKPDPMLVNLLEKLTEMVNSGEVIAIGVGLVYADGRATGTGYADTDPYQLGNTLIAAAVRLQQRLCNDTN